MEKSHVKKKKKEPNDELLFLVMVNAPKKEPLKILSTAMFPFLFFFLVRLVGEQRATNRNNVDTCFYVFFSVSHDTKSLSDEIRTH